MVSVGINATIMVPFWLSRRSTGMKNVIGYCYQLLGGGLRPTDLGPPTSDLQRSRGPVVCCPVVLLSVVLWSVVSWSVGTFYFNERRHQPRELFVDLALIDRSARLNHQLHHLLAEMAAAFEHCPNALVARPL